MKTASELENIIMVKELKIKQQNLEIERLNKENEQLRTVLNSKESIIDKAIKYMNYTFNISSVKEMYEIMNELEKILQGSDKE